MSRPLEGTLTNPTTSASISTLDIMSTECLHCRGVIAGPAKVLGYPYHGMLHPHCVPYFRFTGQYPHPHVVEYYRQAAVEEGENAVQTNSIPLQR